MVTGNTYSSFDNQIEIRGYVFTIPSCETTTESFNFETKIITGIIMPSAFTGTSISFELSYDNSTFYPLYDAPTNALVTISVTTGVFYGIVPQDFTYLGFLRIVSDATEDADREIQIITRKVI